MPSPTAFGPPDCLLLDARGMHAVVLAHFVPPRSNEQSIPPIPVADRSALDLLPATPSLGANTRGFLASRVRRRNGHVYGGLFSQLRRNAGRLPLKWLWRMSRAGADNRCA